MSRFRSVSLLFAAAVLSVAMVACSSDPDAEGDNAGDEPTATAPATTSPDGTPNGDEPTSSVPGDTGIPAETETPSDGGNQSVGDVRRVEAEAPIEEIEVLFLESFPVQHRLHVVSGLPSGCAEFESIEVVRDGTTFTATVINTIPAPDQEIACTMIYGLHESTVDLGDDLEAGTEYTVHVNDKTTTFVAQ